MIRHIRAITVVAGAVVAAALAVHAASQPPTPGRTFSWAASSTPAVSPPSQVSVSLPPSPAPTADAGPLGVVIPPFSALLQRLNADTQTVAQGQYSMLEELEHAVRDRVDQFLGWVTARR